MITNLFSKKPDSLPLEFNPEESDWLGIRTYILNQDRWLLADWLGLVNQQGWQIPEPLLDFAKRKVQDPYGFEFWTAYAAKGHHRELKANGEEISPEQERLILSPVYMKTDGRYMEFIRKADSWQTLIGWKSNLDFDGVTLSVVVHDLFEWKKNQLFEA